MLLPLPSIWSGNPVDEPSARIDRYLADRVQRLAAGIFVPADFSRVVGALTISRGRGKFLRIKHVSGVELDVSDHLARSCREFVANRDASAKQWLRLKTDLAGIQLQVVDQLKALAGKYVDRLLTLSVVDPGFWSLDFDGRPEFSGLCNATLLAELSGITVIDSFAERDLAVGGRGGPLSAIPLWLLLGDRNDRIATTGRAVVSFYENTDYVLLPASDGLDAELPRVGCGKLPGLQFVSRMIESVLQRTPESQEISRLFADGKQNDALIGDWNLALRDERLDAQSLKAQSLKAQSVNGRSLDAQSSELQSPELRGPYEKIAIEFLNGTAGQLSSLITSAVSWMTQKVAIGIRSSAAGPEKYPTEIFVNTDQMLEACLINRLDREFATATIRSMREIAMPGHHLSAVVAAILGLMNIDQLPGNVPWITGADSQRILGRLTPGNAANWRQLLLDMADFQPPAMKLRDAI